jgi:hypothetical protein
MLRASENFSTEIAALGPHKPGAASDHLPWCGKSLPGNKTNMRRWRPKQWREMGSRNVVWIPEFSQPRAKFAPGLLFYFFFA